jgi:molybdenum cofactor cytidylyltransferase
MTDSLRLATIILAAGGSERLGRPKQLVRWRGCTLIEHAVNVAEPVSDAGVIVVAGAAETEVRSALAKSSAEVVSNTSWQRGMSGSLDVGIEALPVCDGMLVMLCDQPLITTEDLNQLLDVWHNHPTVPVASAYNNVIGVPAVFPQDLLEGLSKLTGDRGAGAWLRQREDVIAIDMPNAAIDVDTADDMSCLQDNE